MKITRAVALFCLMCFGVLFAGLPSELGGDLPKILTVDKSPYIVVADLYVPTGKTVIIEPGTVLLFKNFTGLHVRGMLIAKGTALTPVVFSSVNDHKYNKLSNLNPTPFDWNGIYIHKDGIGTDLENVTISYSVKGIFSETKFIRIGNGMFSDNGRSNCTIETEEKAIKSAEPFTYNLSIKDATVDGVPIKILRDPDAPKRNLFRYTGMGICVGGAVFSGIFGYQWYVAQKDFHEYSDTTDLITFSKRKNSVWKTKQTDRNRNAVLVGIGGALLLTGGIAFSYSYTF